ncbi:MAG TPA: DegT/DnrJ/EryC1/StrS family aminotransferase, partial [Chloroflexota bacterium]|nr:DegT/DnrJ/EryC1/StrS family aminotransferase [Chloroflexota bacterium]
YHQYSVRVADRAEVQARLAEEGIGTGVHYPIPVHLQPACRSLDYTEGDLPVTEQLARTVLSLPMYPELTEAQQHEVIAALRAALPAAVSSA